MSDLPGRLVRPLDIRNPAPARSGPRSETRTLLLQMLAAGNGMTVTQLSHRLDVCEDTVRWHLRHLLAAGTVGRRGSPARHGRTRVGAPAALWFMAPSALEAPAEPRVPHYLPDALRGGE